MLALLKTRRFAALFWAQFLSAFGDNILKNAIVFLILFKMSGPHSEVLVTLAGAVFIAPFLFLSALGGEVADRFDKALVARRLKFVEIGAAAVAIIGFALHSLPILFLALFLFGVIAALFGPVKYGILPDHLRLEELPAGNALVEGATFVAIIMGTLVGGFLARDGGHAAIFAFVLMVLSLMCYGAARLIPQTEAANPTLSLDPNVLRSTTRLTAALWRDTRLWRMGMMVSLFWMIGAIVMSLLPPVVKNTLGGTETLASLYLAVFAVSIAIGSGLGSLLCQGRIRLMPVPIAAVIMGLFTLDLARVIAGITPGSGFNTAVAWHVAFDLAGLAIAGGVYIVPSFAAAQHWAPNESRAQIIAAINIVSAGLMVIGALGTAALQGFGLGMSALFLLLALVCGLTGLWSYLAMPKPVAETRSL